MWCSHLKWCWQSFNVTWEPIGVGLCLKSSLEKRACPWVSTTEGKSGREKEGRKDNLPKRYQQIVSKQVISFNQFIISCFHIFTMMTGEKYQKIPFQTHWEDISWSSGCVLIIGGPTSWLMWAWHPILPHCLFCLGGRCARQAGPPRNQAGTPDIPEQGAPGLQTGVASSRGQRLQRTAEVHCSGQGKRLQERVVGWGETR